MIRWLLLVCMTLAPVALAGTVQTRSAKLNLPDSWEHKTDFMGLELMARPALQVDSVGWANDILMLASQPRQPGWKTLQQASVARIAEISHNAQSFKVVSQKARMRNGVSELWLHIRMKEGQRSVEGQLLLMFHDKKLLSAFVSTTQQRYAGRASEFMRIVDSIKT